MESTQKFIEEKKSDADVLKEIVEMVMDAKLMANNRKRCVVEARMVYSNILREYSYSLSKIGISLGKDHTTIIHYVSELRKLLDTDNELFKKYNKCREMFMQEKDPMISTEKNNVTAQLYRLSLRFDELKQENKDLLQQINNLKKESKPRNKRLDRIFKVIEDSTPIGNEFIIERKIIKMFDE